MKFTGGDPYVTTLNCFQVAVEVVREPIKSLMQRSLRCQHNTRCRIPTPRAFKGGGILSKQKQVNISPWVSMLANMYAHAALSDVSLNKENTA